jgi:hypothetical protein
MNIILFAHEKTEKKEVREMFFSIKVSTNNERFENLIF